MHLSTIRISNFRRLTDVKIDLDKEISILVGSNNSGKTSVAEAMHLFLGRSRERISIHDISACKWRDIDAFERGDDGATLPQIGLDLWFEVSEDDLHRVIDLLPSLNWQGTHVGVRITCAPGDPQKTLERFRERHRLAQEGAATATPEGEEHYTARPRTLREYLESEIGREYKLRYFVLDVSQFDADFAQPEDYVPLELVKDQGRSGSDIVKSLVETDFLYAQRHLSDSSAGGRAEQLSRHLGRYYSRNFKKFAEDFKAIKALAESEELLNTHLAHVFADTLDRLSELGYPGIANPRLLIKSALNPATVMSTGDSTQLHYALDDQGFTLPDKYNGLGFKNLIYMVVELLDLHARWSAIEDNRPPLHLVFVEEPEAHLHAQLQQVFANKVLDILAEDNNEPGFFRTQLALTTHSPHILFERGFKPIRYFRREGSGLNQSTSVLNLSDFYAATANTRRDFLERYLKLTHCDLFFADAAILVEGNVERLLMPQMIRNCAPSLRSTYLSVLEIGGAFSHRFRSLIEFLGITTLIITDLDSVNGPIPHTAQETTGGQDGHADHTVENPVAHQTCPPETPGAVTSNQMLRQWLPGRERIDELLALESDEKTLEANGTRHAAVRVTYPGTVELVLGEQRLQRAGRTLEAAFAFENLEWSQQLVNNDLNLHIRNQQNLYAVAQSLHDRIHSSNFKKTDFALGLLSKNPAEWTVPKYISEGLQWLETQLQVDTSSQAIDQA